LIKTGAGTAGLGVLAVREDPGDRAAALVGLQDFYLDWDHVANEVVAILRSEAGRDPPTPPSPARSLRKG
jgi:hypothetical protein